MSLRCLGLLCLAFFSSLTLESLVLSAQQRGQVISQTYLRTFTRSQVRLLLNQYSVPEVFAVPEFDMDVFRVRYYTANARNTGLTEASGAVLIPRLDGQPISCPLPMLSYQHGTTSRRDDVPSRLSAEIQLGALFGSAGGYAVAMPDYLGLGDETGFHPYVHAKSQATATVDLLYALRQLQDSLDFTLNQQLFLYGYSQGGHATMAAFRELQTLHAADFTVTAVAPMSGPYDISGVQAESITAEQPYATPGYLPYVVLGYQEAYGNIYNDLSEIFRPPYDSLIPTLFDGIKDIGFINRQLPDTPKNMLDSAFFQAFSTNPQHPLRAILADNDVYQWNPTAPIYYLYCRGDEQVTYRNSEIAYDTMTARAVLGLRKQDFGNFDHGDCLPFCMLQGLLFFGEFKDNTGGMSLQANVMGASSTSIDDASIELLPSSGSLPYRYVWADQPSNNTAIRTGLRATTNYRVRLSDARNCYLYQNFVPGLRTALASVSGQAWFRMGPNPVHTELWLHLASSGVYRLAVYDALGRLVLPLRRLEGSQLISLDLKSLAAGIYQVQLMDETGLVLEVQTLQKR